MSATIDAPAGDPDALLALADQLDQQATGIGDLGHHLGTTTQSIRESADWTGSAASAYSSFTSGTAQGVTRFEPPLHAVANAIRTYAGVLKSAQQRVADAVHSAHAAADANAADAQTQLGAAQRCAADARSDVDKAASRAAAEIDDQKSGFDRFMEWIGPAAKVNEWAHLPLDLAGADVWLDDFLEHRSEALEKLVKSAEDFSKDLESSLRTAFSDEVGSVAHDFDNGLASMQDVESAFAEFTEATKGTQEALQTVDGVTSALGTKLSWLKFGSRTLTGLDVLSIAGDAITIAHPEDSGAMGTVERVAAGANAAGVATALIEVNASADWIPGVGEAVAAGTGIFLAGDALYHIPAIHDFVNNTVATAWHADKAVWHAVTSWL